MGKSDYLPENNPCLFCRDRECDCSTHEEDVHSICAKCGMRECKPNSKICKLK
jgi:hypothetical protein